jgi:hypothetical protein
MELQLEHIIFPARPCNLENLDREHLVFVEEGCPGQE